MRAPLATFAILALCSSVGARAVPQAQGEPVASPADSPEAVAPPPPPTGTPAEELARGVALFEQQELELAEEALERAATGERFSREDVVKLLHHLGVVRSYLGEDERARAAFKRLLTVSPAHFLPYTISPRTTHLFSDVRAASEGSISVALLAPQRAEWNKRIEVQVENQRDPLGELRALELLVRKQGSANYTTIPVELPAPGEITTVKLDPVSRPELGGDVNLELALIARGERGWELFRGPDPASPRTVAVGLVDKAWYEDEGTLWVLGGTAAAAVVGTALFAALVWPPPEQVPVQIEVR
jgi:hypothetical protein